VDTLTHIALGACIGEIFATKKLGKKALVAGGVAQVIPDVDALCALWMSPSSNVLAHRGFTHSFIFGALISLFLAWVVHRRWNNGKESFIFWIVFFGLQVFVHIFLDAFNAYGTAWFEPFSHYRVSFNVLFVADPFFSVPLGVAALLLFLLPSAHARRISWASGGLIISTLYIGYALFNKFQIDRQVKSVFSERSIPHKQYFTTPTAFNNWLWYIVASGDAGSYVGYRSVFDNQQDISFQFFPRQDSLLTDGTDLEVLNKLKRFSQGYYTAELKGDTLIFNDLRFGQMLGWQRPRAGFVFHYYLKPELDNRLVLQRGRFEGWNHAATHALIDRIKGIK
jgi:inner membrane protein